MNRSLRSGSFDGDSGVTYGSVVNRSLRRGSLRSPSKDHHGLPTTNRRRSHSGSCGSPTNRRGSHSGSFDTGNDHGYGSISDRRILGLKEGDDAERTPLFPDGDASYTTPTASPAAAPRKLSALFLKDKELLQDEIKGMTNLGVPIIFTYLLDMTPDIFTIILVGRVAYDDEVEGGETSNLQKLHLDAAALAIMFINVVALSPGLGILTALDTLASQAFGARQYSKIGTFSLTALAVLSIFFALGSFLIWNASSILIALGQPAEVSRFVGIFLLYRLPGIPFLYIDEMIGTVYECRNNATPGLVTAVVYNVVSFGLGYYLVCWTEWGWLGAAVSRTVADILTVPAILMAAIAFPGSGESDDSSDVSAIEDELDPQGYLEAECVGGADDKDGSKEDDSDFLRDMWKGFVVSEALSGKAINEFLQLGIPGMLQVMFEWVAFEVLALLCGILPGDEAIIGIGANSIVLNITMLTYMPYLGASVAGNVRVGNALGAGDVHRAEVASNLTMACAATMGIVNMMILLSFRDVLPWLFTTDVDIIQQAEQLLLISAMYQLPDAIFACTQGIFRGSGRQALSAKFNFVAFYIIGLPLGYILGITLDFGVVGLWLGMTVGLFCVAIAGAIVILRSDWEQLAAEAALRLDDEE